MLEELIKNINELDLTRPLNELHQVLRAQWQKADAAVAPSVMSGGGGGSPRNVGDYETLSESILYQYAYLERLIQICRKEKSANSPSQLLVHGKDPKYNGQLSDARKKVSQLIQMAEAAAAECQQDALDEVIESKPYDKNYYGQLSNIVEFKRNHKVITDKVLQKAGGKFATLRQNDTAFWKPSSKVFTKDFVKRFPKFASPP